MREVTKDDPAADDGPGAECFVIMPITVRGDVLARYNRSETHFTDVYENLLSPAIQGAGLVPKSPVREGSENIQAAIINDLVNAKLVLVDMSTLNANVFFELGIRTALNKPVCVVWDGFEELPFDTGTINSHRYNPTPGFALNAEISNLKDFIESTRDNSKDGKNALWKYFGTAITSLSSAKIDPESNTSEAKLDVLLKRVDALVKQYSDDSLVGYTQRTWAGRTDWVITNVLREFGLRPKSINFKFGLGGGKVVAVEIYGPPPSEDGFDVKSLALDIQLELAAELGANGEVEVYFSEPF